MRDMEPILAQWHAFAAAPPWDLARFLLSLRMNGWFEGPSGELVGRSAAPESVQPDELSYIDALQSVLGDIQCPVSYGKDIGHVPQQLSFLNGELAEVTLCGKYANMFQRLA